MATTRPPAPIAEALQFRPRWWWDPVPDWVLGHLDSRVIQQLATLQIKTQIEQLKVQQNALEATLQILGKATK